MWSHDFFDILKAKKGYVLCRRELCISMEKVWIGNNDQGERISIIPKMVNRHGLVAGATGTGKTVTLKVMAETFSDMGIPVFMADVKGDIAGMMNPGTDSEDMQKRIEKFNLTDAGFAYKGYPVTLWDIYGVKRNPAPYHHF